MEPNGKRWLDDHPIVPADRGRPFVFSFAGQPVVAHPGDVISSALFASGIRTFGRHPRDGSPQGIYCANGQCSQCMVLADGQPVKACMTPATPGMNVEPVDRPPDLPPVDSVALTNPVEIISVPVLVLGGGPAGLSAAIELGSRGIDNILVDDKDRLGGKLVLQTHRFFGSIAAVYAGTRGIDIAEKLAAQIEQLENVRVWLNSTALAVFSDRRVGVLREATYVLIEPQVLVVATGAREKSIVFSGNTLPGVYGAGAFQTIVNRDLVRAAQRLFIVGGGNVGLIAGYHALQAGIDVVGLAEALPDCGGYKVHRDKLARLGVPIHTSHTILRANGTDAVESVTIAGIDEQSRVIPQTDRTFACDTVLISVGLDSVDEFYRAAKEYELPVYAAGDADEIAEASAAIFSGRITGMEVARYLGATDEKIPAEWYATAEILKSRPGKTVNRSTIDSYLVARRGTRTSRHTREDAPASVDLDLHTEPVEDGLALYPAFHCSQEIPCNPCASVCPQGLIRIDPEDMRRVPEFLGTKLGKACLGCERCVTICPGLAITLVDSRHDPERPAVTIPFEFNPQRLRVGDEVAVVDTKGQILGSVPVTDVRALAKNDRTVLVTVVATPYTAPRIAGIRIQEPSVGDPLPAITDRLDPSGESIDNEAVVCRCERVTAGQIRELIREGCRDINEIKAVTRAGMGACGGKTCQPLILSLFLDEGISLDEVTENVRRPLFVEAPFGAFAGVDRDEKA